MRKVLLFTVVLELSVLFLILFFIEKFDKIDFTPARYTPFSGIFPNSNPTFMEEKGWEGYSFKEGLRVFYLNIENPDSLLEEYRNWYTQKEKAKVSSISMGNKAFIMLRRLQKGYTAIAVISLDTVIVWADITSRGSTLDTKFEYFCHFLKELKYNEKPLARDDLARELINFRKSIPLTVMQDKYLFLAFMVGILLFANLITFISLFYGGSCPRRIAPEWEIITPKVMVYEKLPIGQRSYTACLIKKGNEILIHSFGKIRHKFLIGDPTFEIKFLGNKLHIGNQFRFEFPDEESLMKWQAAL